MEALLIEKYGPFMDLPEIASLLKVEARSIYSQINRGKLDLPHIKHVKKYLFPTPEVAAFLESKITNYPL
jgi:predicted DNA-binding transcriptional regulator AlpA